VFVIDRVHGISPQTAAAIAGTLERLRVTAGGSVADGAGGGGGVAGGEGTTPGGTDPTGTSTGSPQGHGSSGDPLAQALDMPPGTTDSRGFGALEVLAGVATGSALDTQNGGNGVPGGSGSHRATTAGHLYYLLSTVLTVAVAQVFSGLKKVGSTVAQGITRAARGTSLEGANFAQKTYGSMFSRGGAFAGRSVDDVAGALRSGAMSPSEVPINYIVRDGNTLILNTRSAQALEAAGIPRSAWNAVNRTGQEMFENMLTGQLQRNGLTSAGTATVRRSGGM